MRLPKRGEKGFTLIELLIVVAILGVLAGVVIPNVGRFSGRGEEEAKDTELKNIQAAVLAMMTDNNLPIIPHPVASGNRTNNMGAFPDADAVCGVATEKYKDPNATIYGAGDKAGFLLYQHDITANNSTSPLVNYVAANQTSYWYTVDTYGTVTQYDTAP